MSYHLFPKKIFKIILFLILFLVLANILGILYSFYMHPNVHTLSHGLILLFDLNQERNIPTLYSSIALVFASILLLWISIMHKNLKSPYKAWFVLSLIFLFLAIDETASIHERLTTPIRDALNTSGFLYDAWIIPYCRFIPIPRSFF